MGQVILLTALRQSGSLLAARPIVVNRRRAQAIASVPILTPSLDAGINAGMEGTRKITVEVSESLLKDAQSQTGQGVTATVTEGLKHLASVRAQQELAKLRGKVKFSLTWQEMKGDDE